MKERDKRIYQMRVNGATLQKIGDEVKLCKESVRRICRKVEDELKGLTSNRPFESELSTRTKNVLKNSFPTLESFEDLSKIGEHYILRYCRNAGERVVLDIKKALKRRSLFLIEKNLKLTRAIEHSTRTHYVRGRFQITQDIL